MPRERSPNRDIAKQIWLDSGGKMKLKDIAASIGVGETQIRKWKSQDKWDADLKGNVTNAPKGNVTKRGAPKGNSNADGNRGGNGGPVKNDKAVKHGLFRKYLPDDEETREIYDNVGQMNSLDLLWENIQIKFTAIVRAQKIMFVRDRDDETKVLKREKRTDTGWEDEHELQHAWDKQANFLNAQARSMSTLTSMIRQYEEMCRLGWADEEQQLRIEKLKAEVKALENTGGDNDNGNIDQLADMIKKSAEAIGGA